MFYSSFLVLLILSILDHGKSSNTFRFILLFFLILISATYFGYRKGGIDFEGYLEIFNNAAFDNFSLKTGIFSGGEPIFYYLNAFVKYISNDFSLFLFFVFFLSVGIKFFVVSQVSPYPILSIILLYSISFEQEIGQIRHAFVASCILLSTYLIAINKGKSSYFSVVIGLGFHLSMVFQFFFLFLSKYFSLREFFMFILLVVVLTIFSLDVFYILVPFLNSIGFDGISSVITNYLQISGKSEIGIFYLFYFTVACFLLVYQKSIKADVIFNTFFKQYLFGFLLTGLFWNSVVFSGRMFELFSETAFCIIIPIFISKLEYRQRLPFYYLALLFAYLKFFTAFEFWEEICPNIFIRCN